MMMKSKVMIFTAVTTLTKRKDHLVESAEAESSNLFLYSAIRFLWMEGGGRERSKRTEDDECDDTTSDSSRIPSSCFVSSGGQDVLRENWDDLSVGGTWE